jgi:hypothetical protein
VLQSGLGDVVNGILNKLPLEPQSEQFWTVLFQEAKIYHAPILLLLKVGMGNVMLEQITAHAAVREKSNDAAAYYNSVFWAGAVYNVLINWVRFCFQFSTNFFIVILSLSITAKISV